ncbi:MAG: 3'-5' exonuclease domain-containing protein 2 [Bacteroides sp.]|nr:3'-5' exonuclease domain-containing protein 2 [Bacteroides sp.]
MLIRRTIDKEKLKEMPKAAFPGTIHLVNTPQEAEQAVAYLKRQTLLGIDTETRPSFSRGQIHKVALLQVADEKHCFLFRLNLTGLTLPIILLLENPGITKVGLSLKDDFHMLKQRAPFKEKGIIELQEFVRPFGIREMSLQKIYGILFGEKISKTQRLTNWEADRLTQAQQLYAATDAWSCLQIYNLLQELMRTGDFTIEEAPEEEKSEEVKQVEVV